MDRRGFLKASGLGGLGCLALSTTTHATCFFRASKEKKYNLPSPENIQVGDIRIKFYDYNERVLVKETLSFSSISMGRVVKVGREGYHVNHSGLQYDDQEYGDSEHTLLFLRPNNKNLEIVAASTKFQGLFSKFMEQSSKLIGKA